MVDVRVPRDGGILEREPASAGPTLRFGPEPA